LIEHKKLIEDSLRNTISNINCGTTLALVDDNSNQVVEYLGYLETKIICKILEEYLDSEKDLEQIETVFGNKIVLDVLDSKS